MADKGELTKQWVTDTALRLLRERGYARTTMRLIAEEAGVSLGNAYYYYPSKDHLVQELYRRLQYEHRAAAAPVLAASTDFTERLRGVLGAALEIFAPYHSFGGEFIGSALPPDSPTSPFGAETAEAREVAIGIFREVIEGSTLTVPAMLREELPELLWSAYMAGVMFWVYDRSDGQQKTRELLDRVAPMAATLVTLAKIPLLRGQISELLAIVALVKS